jgi:hypothetical protein
MAQDTIFETYVTADTFCESLARIDHLGHCRRLVFTVRDMNGDGRAVVAKLILPVEVLAEIAHMLATDAHVLTSLASLSPDALAN